mgnify:CR=1 FL=1
MYDWDNNPGDQDWDRDRYNFQRIGNLPILAQHINPDFFFFFEVPSVVY